MADDQIEPDTKDWTWVLDAPCPECGFQAEAVSGDEIPALVEGYAERWEHVLTRADVVARPAPQMWSPLEYACHVRDVFTVFARRARLMLAEDGPDFENWDQDEAAIAGRYGEQDPAVVARELRAASQDAVAAFTGVADAEWDRPGYRSNGSQFTVLSLGRYFVHDVVHHLHDVRG
ncbi:DinB family protein [Actinotalea ferrariae]|uniref:DinB family protein n=1 Tax=Actinotalea ferrariae TaxID=1386098 RepID=UPI001C8C5552|nr:DinB family protein [Actinotalea ferrariae]MBX9243473.1 DinB family protein [Actinotalea ferrariae]